MCPPLKTDLGGGRRGTVTSVSQAPHHDPPGRSPFPAVNGAEAPERHGPILSQEEELMCRQLLRIYHRGRRGTSGSNSPPRHPAKRPFDEVAPEPTLRRHHFHLLADRLLHVGGKPGRGGSGPARLRDSRLRSRAANLDAGNVAAYRTLACRASRLSRHVFVHVFWCFNADGAGTYFRPHSAQRLRSSRPSTSIPGRLPERPTPATFQRLRRPS